MMRARFFGTYHESRCSRPKAGPCVEASRATMPPQPASSSREDVPPPPYPSQPMAVRSEVKGGAFLGSRPVEDVKMQTPRRGSRGGASHADQDIGAQAQDFDCPAHDELLETP